MQTLIKIFFIFLFYWIGEFLSYLMGGFVPGSVLGMLLLFLALQLKLVKVHQIDSPARALTDNMGLFFIPAGVGLMAQLDTVVANWWVILVAVIVSSVLVIASVAYVQDQMERRRKYLWSDTSSTARSSRSRSS